MLTLKYLKDKAEQLQKVTGCLLCIAGGAPRDILNDKPVKDIDVFVSCEADYVVDEVLQILKEELGISCEKISGNPEASDSESPVYEAEWEGHKWQFIFKFDSYPSLDSFITNLIEDFDYGFCQVAVAPYKDDEYTSTLQFEDDMTDKKIRRNTDIPIREFQTDNAKARLKRLQDKYPEFTIEPLPEPRNLMNEQEQRIITRIRRVQENERAIQGRQADIQIIDDIIDNPMTAAEINRRVAQFARDHPAPAPEPERFIWEPMPAAHQNIRWNVRRT